MNSHHPSNDNGAYNIGRLPYVIIGAIAGFAIWTYFGARFPVTSWFLSTGLILFIMGLCIRSGFMLINDTLGSKQRHPFPQNVPYFDIVLQYKKTLQPNITPKQVYFGMILEGIRATFFYGMAAIIFYSFSRKPDFAGPVLQTLGIAAIAFVSLKCAMIVWRFLTLHRLLSEPLPNPGRFTKAINFGAGLMLITYPTGILIVLFGIDKMI